MVPPLEDVSVCWNAGSLQMSSSAGDTSGRGCRRAFREPQIGLWANHTCERKLRFGKVRELAGWDLDDDETTCKFLMLEGAEVESWTGSSASATF